MEMFGHTLKNPITTITHLFVEWKPKRARRKCRSKKSMSKTIQQEQEDLKMTWNEVKWNA